MCADVFEDFDLIKYNKAFKKKKLEPTKIYLWNLNSKSVYFREVNKSSLYIEGSSKDLIKSFFITLMMV